MRKPILQELFSHIPQLVRHLIASYTVEKIYAEYASNPERYEMLQELYHPEFRRFKTKDKLAKIVETREKANIMQNILASIKPVVEKGILGDLTIIQQAALDYLSLADDAAKRELLSTIHPVAILHNREGAKLAIAAIAMADARERKKILREFRSFVSKIASEEFGHAVMMEAFDTVDDTVLISTTIGRELIEDSKKLDELLDSSCYARRAVLFAIVGRSSRLFPPSQLDALCTNGKKDAFKRHREVRAIFSEALLATAMRKASTWLTDADKGQFCVEVLVRGAKSDEAGVSEISSIVHASVNDASAAGDLTTLRNVKRLLQYERSWLLANTKAKIPEGYSDEGRSEISLEIAKRCEAIVSGVFAKFTPDDLLMLATSAGAFVALAFCEDKHTGNTACAMLRKHAAKIKKSAFPGSNLVYDLVSLKKA